MTREEAYKKLESLMKERDELYPHIYAYVEFNQADDLIEKIYEDFESRICKNCKYFIESLGWCENMENGAMNDGAFISVNKDFGCNRFKRR